MPMSAEHIFLINFAIFECQNGPSSVAWRQLGASLPDSRCWPFLLLTRHSKGNAGIDELACRFYVFPGRLCPQKTPPSAGCHSLSWHTGQKGNMPSPSPCSLKPSCLNSGLHLVFTPTGQRRPVLWGKSWVIISPGRCCYTSWWVRQESLTGVWRVKLIFKK